MPESVRSVARIHQRTPADRERALDGFRALAMVGVVVGHWLVGALLLHEDGSLSIVSPLGALAELAPASWFLQMLGLFFLVGGYATARSLCRASERGSSYGHWLRQRYVRLGRPVVAAASLSATSLVVLHVLGVPEGTLRTWVVLFVQPLWFVAIYGVLTALTGYALAVDRRLSAWAAAPLLVIVVIVDLLRYGPWQDVIPGWLALINLIPGWLFAYQLGVSWAQGRLARAGAWLLLGGGALLFALLILTFGYPASMVGVPGETRTNSHPPSLLVLALAAAQCGAAVLLRGRVERLLQKPRLWAGVVALNLCAMTILCWHQVPNVLVSAVAASFGGLPGLTNQPVDSGWLLVRLAWLPVLALVLGGIVAVVSRLEQPWTGVPRVARWASGALAAGFVVTAAALY